MSRNFFNLPPDVRACLWSYDFEKLDLKRDREEIITRVLNYGTWIAVKWALATYPGDEIRDVLRAPARGRWFRQCLNFWLLQFDMILPPNLFHRALFQLNPTKTEA